MIVVEGAGEAQRATKGVVDIEGGCLRALSRPYAVTSASHVAPETSMDLPV